ncbi:hypothetical protein LCGC14_1481040 [marine sediment metagenome]|uniref:Uncharacterized protein n=1 Tax=marine sediment metagenome TaxID=412755 RepID=A0A0F9J9I6_9ZZZZ
MADFPRRYDIREIPWDKHPLLPGPGIQAGVLALKCIVNSKCPFVKTPGVHESMVFNERTLSEEVWKAFPKDFQNFMTYTTGTEGIHFKPKYVYRHNYLITSVGEDDIPKELKESSDAANTRYKDEQTWIVDTSPFLEGVEEPVSSIAPECQDGPLWSYLPLPTVRVDSTQDKKLDYKKNYEGEGDQGVKPKDIVQFIQQGGSAGCTGEGIHWKVIKETPLFKGEDFFIHLRNSSTSSNVTLKKPLIIPEGSYYESLEVNLRVEETETDPTVIEEEEKKSPHRLSLSDQAYFVIEMGHGDPIHNYFIIICEREYPVFIHISPNSVPFVNDSGTTEWKDHARVLSYFNKRKGGIHGNDLLDAKEFRVTVRNHLGKIVVQFDDFKTEEINPWIIDRFDYERAEDNSLIAKKGVMHVPRGEMTLWGGNRRCAFNFGPLQYGTPDILFSFPPKPTDMSQVSSSDLTAAVSTSSIVSLPKFFSLPQYPDGSIGHNIKLTVTGEEIEDLLKRINIPSGEVQTDYLFTHDAQFFKEDIKFPPDSNGFSHGFFYFDYPIRELADNSVGDVKDSSIELSKNKNSIHFDEARRMERFVVDISMQCGDHIFGEDLNSDPNYMRDYISDSDDSFDDDVWKLSNCKTPILSSFRLESQVDNNPRWKDGVYEIDVSDNVLEYSESWSASDFFNMDHTGTIKFLLNPGMNVENNAYESLYDLQNRAFYVDIWAGYKDCNYTLLGGFYKLFTGICYGGEITYQENRYIMTCKVYDYKKVLEDQLFFNSPFYDGVYDIHAVKEIMDLAGFRSLGTSNPGSLIRYIAENRDSVAGTTFVFGDGRVWKYLLYALPSEYNRLEQPAFKFSDGDNYLSAIRKISQQAGKLFYFDQHGFAHFEDYLDIVQAAALGVGGFPLSFAFTTNPFIFPGQQIFNSLDHNYAVESIYNHIRLVSNTPDQTLLIHDNLNFDSLDDPLQPGFLGYMNELYQRAPVWGSQKALRRIGDFYRVMFKPAIQYSFETYGVPMRSLDFILINNQAARVMKVQHILNAEKNEWWMKVECERYQPIEGVGSFLEESSSGDETGE